MGVHDSLNLLCAHQLTDSFFRLKDQIVALGINIILGIRSDTFLKFLLLDFIDRSVTRYVEHLWSLADDLFKIFPRCNLCLEFDSMTP